jgi:hypothetical protein
LHSCFNARRAEIALRRRVAVWVNIKRVVRAGLHTGFAAYAAAVVEIDDTIIAFEKSRGRTDGYTRRILTMIATQHREKSLGVRIVVFFDVLDPGAIGADRHFIFRFTGDCASVTTYAFSVVYQESIFHIISDERFVGIDFYF